MYAAVRASSKTEGKSTARETSQGERSTVLLRKMDGHDSDSLARLVSTDASVGCSPGVGQRTSSERLSRLIHTGSIQTKLKVSKPNDKMEQEI